MSTSSRDAHHVRTGLVGYGLGGGTFHAPLVEATPGLDLVGIVTRDESRRAEASRRHPGARLVGSLAELLDMGVELVVISSPSGMHASMAREALARGCHVVVDKPFATSAAEAREIGELAERVGRLAIPFQNRRWDGDFRTLQRLVHEGTLGTIHRLESRFERWRRTVKPRWMLPDARGQAEGIVFDLGSHLVDQALVLLGPARRVYAELARVRPEVTVEDDAFLALEHASGARSHLYMSTAAALSGARFTLSGELGSYAKHGLDGQEAALQRGEVPGAPGWGIEPPERWGTLALAGREVPFETRPGAYEAFYRKVQEAAAGGTEPPVQVREAVAALAVIDAAFRSAAEGRPVEIEP